MLWIYNFGNATEYTDVNLSHLSVYNFGNIFTLFDMMTSSLIMDQKVISLKSHVLKLKSIDEWPLIFRIA